MTNKYTCIGYKTFTRKSDGKVFIVGSFTYDSNEFRNEFGTQCSTAFLNQPPVIGDEYPGMIVKGTLYIMQ